MLAGNPRQAHAGDVGLGTFQNQQGIDSYEPKVVLDRELEEAKKPGKPESPRIHCPLCGWSPRTR